MLFNFDEPRNDYGNNYDGGCGNGECGTCGKKPRQRTCADCGVKARVLACGHEYQAIRTVNRRSLCVDCIRDRQEQPANPLGNAVGTIVGVGVGLAVTGLVLDAFDGDGGGFDF